MTSANSPCSNCGPVSDPSSRLSILVNGEPRTIAARTTVATLLEDLSLQPRFVAVERNYALVPRREHASCVLAEGDRLEIVTLVGGG